MSVWEKMKMFLPLLLFLASSASAFVLEGSPTSYAQFRKWAPSPPLATAMPPLAPPPPASNSSAISIEFR